MPRNARIISARTFTYELLERLLRKKRRFLLSRRETRRSREHGERWAIQRQSPTTDHGKPRSVVGVGMQKTRVAAT